MANIKINSKVLIACIVIVAGACFVCAYSFFNKPIALKTRTSMHSALQKTKEIDKLFTGVYIVPALDKKYGYRKRDMPMEMMHGITEKLGVMQNTIKEPEKVVKGYCKKRYEVYVGYDNLSDLLRNSDVIDNACHERTEKLPNPKILAVNCKNTEARGNYKGDDMCYRWDGNENMRNSVLLNQMREDNIIEKVNKRGRESLKTIATIFCE